jgi:methyl-accepting chemotaxis protein
MENAHVETAQARSSIKRRFIVFSTILFLVIFGGGSGAFFVSISQIVHRTAEGDISQQVEIERIKLEASVNSEIAIALKMADSPLIKQYFLNPDDPGLEALAFAEIAGYRRAFAAKSVFWVSDADKRFYASDAYAYTVDVQDPSNYWYSMTLNETETYNFNINYNPDLKITNLWINAPVFDENKKPIGIVGTGIDLSSFIDSIYRSFSARGELYFFNAAGEITAADDEELVAAKKTLGSHLGGGVGDHILNASKGLSGGTPKSLYVSGKAIAVGTVPALGWYITIIMPLTLGAYLNSSMTVLFLAMMGVICIIFVVVNVFMSRFLKPLNGMVDALGKIALDWDLTRRLEIRGKDEIGNLAEFFNRTFERIGALIRDIKNQTFSLSDTGEELAANMNETAAAINEITANVQNMKNQVTAQAGEVSLSGAAVERIIAGLEKLNGHIEVQAESVAQSSSAIDPMLANIRSVTDTLIKNTENINSLADSSGTSRTDLQKVSTDIQEIARESEGLLEINSVMQNIASQTNLLSMNAAIEAAHAGESGKGFAVVADEIRKLAENSGQQSKTISAVLKKIKTSIDAITKSTAIVLERFEMITQEVQTVSNQEAQIRSAMEEQETGSRHILEAVGQLNSVTGLVKTASAEMAAESREVISQSTSLRRISDEVSGGMDEMALGADQINTAVNRVNEISVENKNNIGALSGAISRFKVE